ncbi:hypothetical protein BS47DRAFT_1360474 [Hydnum rufescens UP504]|uniref:Uncharacterized protein n=1 Tax=Hydnum rufescens UP504 TaxID=1448309 RepID=A0A9P6DYZ1_9AGAM|nr:hypothetical protein BS47DRAFT_1360474 [Hydnum rufescens UP504]
MPLAGWMDKPSRRSVVDGKSSVEQDIGECRVTHAKPASTGDCYVDDNINVEEWRIEREVQEVESNDGMQEMAEGKAAMSCSAGKWAGGWSLFNSKTICHAGWILVHPKFSVLEQTSLPPRSGWYQICDTFWYLRNQPKWGPNWAIYPNVVPWGPSVAPK